MIRASTLLATLIHTKASHFSHAYSTLPSTIKNIVIVGGTHGNEYTGIWCSKSISQKRSTYEQKYPSLDISTFIGNNHAFLENRRFIDVDLNREFSSEKLSSKNSSPVTMVESIRARDINDQIGPKFDDSGNLSISPRTDMIVDLHSTTANMGMALIVPEGDVAMTRAVAYVLKNYGKEYGEVRCILYSIPDRADHPFLPSLAKHGFTVEVGPVPQGVLRHDAVEKTMRVVELLLEFSERWNKEGGDAVTQELEEEYEENRVPCFRQVGGKISWGRDEENPNFPNFMVHKSVQDGDFKTIRRGDPLFVTSDGKVIKYDGSHGEEVQLIFINEGGYYYETSGRGIGVAQACHFDLLTGNLLTLESNSVSGEQQATSSRKRNE